MGPSSAICSIIDSISIHALHSSGKPEAHLIVVWCVGVCVCVCLCATLSLVVHFSQCLDLYNSAVTCCRRVSVYSEHHCNRQERTGVMGKEESNCLVFGQGLTARLCHRSTWNSCATRIAFDCTQSVAVKREADAVFLVQKI